MLITKYPAFVWTVLIGLTGLPMCRGSISQDFNLILFWQRLKKSHFCTIKWNQTMFLLQTPVVLTALLCNIISIPSLHPFLFLVCVMYQCFNVITISVYISKTGWASVVQCNNCSSDCSEAHSWWRVSQFAERKESGEENVDLLHRISLSRYLILSQLHVFLIFCFFLHSLHF